MHYMEALCLNHWLTQFPTADLLFGSLNIVDPLEFYCLPLIPNSKQLYQTFQNVMESKECGTITLKKCVVILPFHAIFCIIEQFISEQFSELFTNEIVQSPYPLRSHGTTIMCNFNARKTENQNGLAQVLDNQLK